MHKTLATQISIFLISILSSLFLFSCTEPNDVNTNESEDKNKANEETPSYYAMIGTWINPGDNSDTITISEDTVTLSITAAKKYENDLAREPYELEIKTAHPLNAEFIQEMK